MLVIILYGPYTRNWYPQPTKIFHSNRVAILDLLQLHLEGAGVCEETVEESCLWAVHPLLYCAIFCLASYQSLSYEMEVTSVCTVLLHGK